MIYFTSDLHLGHRSIPKYRTKFKDSSEHDEYILNEMEKLGKRDILYILGDFLFPGAHYEEYIKRIRKMPCRIKLIMGNHDSTELYNEDRTNWGRQGSTIEVQLPLFSYKNFWLSHCPIHPHELRNRRGNIHGHMHLEKLDYPYFNVNLDVNDYKFVDFEYIKDEFEKEEQGHP